MLILYLISLSSDISFAKKRIQYLTYKLYINLNLFMDNKNIINTIKIIKIFIFNIFIISLYFNKSNDLNKNNDFYKNNNLYKKKVF